VSHDLRTPLAAISGAASSLAADEERLSAAARRELTLTLFEESQRMNRLATNLLDMGRLQSADVALVREWQPIEEVLGAALEQLARSLEGREVKLRIPDDLPLVPIDDVLIERALVNLLENAARYTPAGSPIEVTASASPAEVEVEVADRGPGLAPDESTAIFARFQRGAAAGSRGGVGLGLAIARAIVEAHGGRIWAENRAGGGRVVPLHPAAHRHSARRSRGAGARAVSMPATVLLIEDDPQIRRFLRATLPAHGYTLLEAGTGAEGLTTAATRMPEVVLLDLGLPDIDGLEVVRRLREWSAVAIIVLTARGLERDKVTALDAGADDYLTKPFGVEELLARLRVALRHACRSAAGQIEPVISAGELQVDVAGHRALVAGVEVHLTPTEFKLLAVLARHLDRVVTHRQLLIEVWGPGAATNNHYLRVQMHSLRRKIEREPARPRHLLTEPGVGYRLRA